MSPRKKGVTKVIENAYFCNMIVEQNIARLRYLLSLFKMREDDLLSEINEGRKHLIRKDQVFSLQIDVKILKKIDTIFEKGLPFYLDPTPLQPTGSMSVFFRKQSFSCPLNFTAKKLVDDYEGLKNYLSSLDILSEIETIPTIKHCTTATNPRNAAERVRQLIYPKRKCSKSRDFLKNLINNLADQGILVVEFIEAPNKKDKANIDGFFLGPNFIVLKRQSYYKREIFTLLHELGHYLLNNEDIESQDVANMNYASLSAIERWCNDFAYYFLVGEQYEIMDKIQFADGTNDYCHPIIEQIANTSFISRRALFTRLLYSKRISQPDYENVVRDLEEQYEKIKLQRAAALVDADGRKKKISAPQPIYSPMFIRTLSVAYSEGNLRACDLTRMKIPAKVVEGLTSWL